MRLDQRTVEVRPKLGTKPTLKPKVRPGQLWGQTRPMGPSQARFRSMPLFINAFIKIVLWLLMFWEHKKPRQIFHFYLYTKQSFGVFQITPRSVFSEVWLCNVRIIDKWNFPTVIISNIKVIYKIKKGNYKH